MSKTSYADLISDMHFSGGMIRMDVASIDTTKKIEEKKGPSIKIDQQIVMPTDGFLRTFNHMQMLMNKLVEAGVLKVNKPEEVKEGKNIEFKDNKKK